ncbi:MAG: hypothetical protein M1541_05590 [Acidobacteria bacterium]|nr:hypothetical protein [Acidobacteriota bacterium]
MDLPRDLAHGAHQKGGYRGNLQTHQLGDLPIPQSFGPEFEYLPLRRGHERQGGFDQAATLGFQQCRLGIRRVRSPGFLLRCLCRPSLRAAAPLVVDREVVTDLEGPGAKVLNASFLLDGFVEPEKNFLNDVFGRPRIAEEAREVPAEPRSEFLVLSADPLLGLERFRPSQSVVVAFGQRVFHAARPILSGTEQDETARFFYYTAQLKICRGDRPEPLAQISHQPQVPNRGTGKVIAVNLRLPAKCGIVA